MGVRLVGSHRRATLPLTMVSRGPSGEKATVWTVPVSPVRGAPAETKGASCGAVSEVSGAGGAFDCCVDVRSKVAPRAVPVVPDFELYVFLCSFCPGRSVTTSGTPTSCGQRSSSRTSA